MINEKCYRMKHGQVGSRMRHEIEGYVIELIDSIFLAEAGKRKEDFYL